MALLNINSIVRTFSLLYGENETGDFSIFISTAAKQISAMIKDGCKPADYMDAACYAAACLAFYRCNLKQASTSLPSFKAGDITIGETSQSKINSSKALFLDALDALKPFCIDRTFCFRRI